MKKAVDQWSKEELYTLPTWQLKLIQVVKSTTFDLSVAVFILAAAVVSGLRQTEEGRSDDDFFSILVTIDDVILVVFSMEFLIRLLSVYPNFNYYFIEPWNVFDFLIVLFGYLEWIINSAGDFDGSNELATITRLFRLLRVLRLFRVLKDLQSMVKALARTMYQLGWIFLVLLIVFYLYAVIGVAFFRENDPFYFEDIAIAMVTLFRVATSDSWTAVLYVSQYGCDRFGEIQPPACKPHAFGYIAVLYFVSFIVLATFVIFNLFVGIVMMHMLEIKADDEEVKDREGGGDMDKDTLMKRLDGVNRMLTEMQGDMKKMQ